MCDHLKLDVRTRVRAHINLDVRGACVRPKKRSQPMPWNLVTFDKKYEEQGKALTAFV